MNVRFLNRSATGLDDVALRRLAPSIFAQSAWDRMSDRYAFIPTSAVVQRMREEGFVPVQAAQNITRIAGKREYARHLLRFQRLSDLRAERGAREVGDLVPEIALMNSHDGSSAYTLTPGMLRLACTNGLLVSVSSGFETIRARHTGDVVDEVIEGSYRIIKQSTAAIERAHQFSKIELAPPQRLAFAHAALVARWGEDAEKTAPITAEKLLTTRRHEDEKPDAFTTMNVVQENIMKGGLRDYGTASARVARQHGRRPARLRAINSVTEDVRINKALWTLMEELAKIAA